MKSDDVKEELRQRELKLRHVEHALTKGLLSALQLDLKAKLMARLPAAEFAGPLARAYGLEDFHILVLLPESREVECRLTSPDGRFELQRLSMESISRDAARVEETVLSWKLRRPGSDIVLETFKGPDVSYDGEHYSSEGFERVEFIEGGRALRMTPFDGGHRGDYGGLAPYRRALPAVESGPS